MYNLIIQAEWPIILFYVYFIGINIYALLSIGRDKFKAKKHKRRTPEKHFLFLGLIGGALGVFIGMQIFRHKTKHAKFKYGVPVLIIYNIALIYYIYYFLDLIIA
ncbi:MAG: DUF1294 domain-containing protein [Peptococcaceae bacterium]|jgi:uncharacterized membrane protein YsdA (DUF1294 family)|nr:DUF1294 domain-containing protein [Peptococcaceae bacterium]